jgi:hypothetical protein
MIVMSIVDLLGMYHSNLLLLSPSDVTARSWR